jgi:hypothetical protein
MQEQGELNLGMFFVSKRQASDTIDAIFYSLTITYETRQVVIPAFCIAYWLVIVS